MRNDYYIFLLAPPPSPPRRSSHLLSPPRHRRRLSVCLILLLFRLNDISSFLAQIKVQQKKIIASYVHLDTTGLNN